MKKSCQNDLKSINGGNPTLPFIGGALLSGAVYDFAQGVVEGVKNSQKAENRKRKYKY